jgi:hypothetical protein
MSGRPTTQWLWFQTRAEEAAQSMFAVQRPGSSSTPQAASSYDGSNTSPVVKGVRAGIAVPSRR